MTRASDKGQNAIVEAQRSTSPSLYREHFREHTTGSTSQRRWPENSAEIRPAPQRETCECPAVPVRSWLDRSRTPERHWSLPARCDIALFDAEDGGTGTADARVSLAANSTLRRATDLRKICVAPPTSFAHREENQPAVEDADLPRILVDGFVLANRYILKGERIAGRRLCRLADDRFTGQIVFLKFYPRFSTIYRHAARMHRRLQKSQAVCELIEILPNSNGLPPCLVFQAGSFTLARRLEKRALSITEQQNFLHSILQVLCDVHGQDIVHGHVDTHHIMWFDTDFCWKLVDLDTASAVGDPVPIHRITSRRHTAPEIQEAMNADSIDTPSDTSSDMWSFGIVAFQILTGDGPPGIVLSAERAAFLGASAFDAACVKRHINRERLWIEEGHDRRDLVLAFESDPQFSKSAKQRRQEFDFVLQLMTECPAQRKTAVQALGKARFETVPKKKTPEKALEDFLMGRGALDDIKLSKGALCRAATCHLVLSIAIERFARDENPKAAFHEKSASKMKHSSIRGLPTDPVYVLTVGESFRVCISIGRDTRLRLPFEAITSITVAVSPDIEGHALNIWQRNRGSTLDALALIDPSEIPSERLNRPSAIFGSTDGKYVKLEFRVTFRLGGDFPYDIDMFPTTVLRLKRRPIWRNCFGKRIK